jgi:two-component system, NarL family, invasion response regulator UvrY
VIRVLIVDDHRIFREGVKRLLRETADIAVVGEAADGAQALEALRAGGVDVAVLDISMPGRNGLDVLSCIRERWPQVAVVMLSMYPEEQYAAPAFRAGATGYLTKDSGLEELVGAIRHVARGGRYASTRLAEKLAGMQDEGPALPHHKLSAREYQIFELIVGGQSLTGIAAQLHVSVSTVSTYRVRVLEKLAIQSNAELVAYAIRNRLRD